MRTQEILTRVNEAIGYFGDKLCTSRDVLESLARDLEAQLRLEIANSKGVSNAVKTITALLKPELKGARPGLAYPWVDAEGRQCVCNGFVAFRMRNHLPLPERPANAGEGIDLDRVFPSDTTGYKALPMPSAKEIREFIAVERAKFTGRPKNFEPVWDFGPEAPSVNAHYLLDAATVFPNAETILWNTLVSILVIKCEDGDAALCPLRTNKRQPQPASEEERKAVEAEQQRRENIRKAHDEYNAAQKEAGEAQMTRHKAHIEAENASDDATKAKAMQTYYEHCDIEAKARLRSYAAAMIFDADYDITTGQFEYLVHLLYAREYAGEVAA